MKIKHSIALFMLIASWSAVGVAEPVYMIHGINGTELGVTEKIPVDLYVDGLCIDGITSNVAFSRVVGPLDLPTGSYAVEVRLSTSPVCDDGPLAISGEFDVGVSGMKTIVAHLSSSGAPTISEINYLKN